MEKFTDPLGLSKTFLFSPGHRPEFFQKALDTKSQAIILDLEDAVPQDLKAQARGHISAFLHRISPSEASRIVLRMNAIGSHFFQEDMQFLKHLHIPVSVMLPKTESFEQLKSLTLELNKLVWLIPLIETALGFDHVQSIATHPKVLRLALGNIDMQADLGFQCDAIESELVPVRFGIALASRLSNLAPPIDGVCTEINQLELLQAATLRAKRLGFGAKLCIHPKQVDTVIECLSPTAEEIHAAKRIVDADIAANGAAFQLDGKMVDRPVVMLAQRILRLANRLTR
jgi:citrate lyase subunit beta / citryl-CoA lyase